MISGAGHWSWPDASLHPLIPSRKLKVQISLSSWPSSHLGRMNLLQAAGLVCAAHHRSVAFSSDSLPARFEKPHHVGKNSTTFRSTESL